MTTTPAPDTVVRKKRATLRVFGDSFATDLSEIVDDSLTYSTTTEKGGSSERKKKCASSADNNDENAPNMAAASAMPRFSASPAKKKPKAPSLSTNEPGKSNKRVCFGELPVEEEKQENNSSLTETSLVDTQPTSREQEDPFHSHRSPLRAELVRRTREAIRQATISVNATMQIGSTGVRRVAPNSAANQAMWREQIEEAREFNDRMQGSRFRLLAIQKQIASEGSRNKARRHEVQRAKNLAQIEKESQFNSMVYREQQHTLREDAQRRRRQSEAARSKLRQNAAKGKEEMHKARQKEDNALMEERHASSRARSDKLTQDAAARRISLAFRNSAARRVRNQHVLNKAKRQQVAHQSFLLDQAANGDMDEYKLQLKLDRRMSLARRNASAAQQRKQEEERQAKQSAKQHESYQLKFAGERDAEKYKKQLEMERRQYLAQRNKEAHRQRIQEDARQDEELKVRHESFELKWGGEKDAEKYKKRLEEERRQSLAFRGREALRIRDFEEGEATKQFNAQRDYYESKWGAEKDVEEYKKQMEEEHRQSLALRNAERCRHESVMKQLQRIAHEKECDTYKAQQSDAKDVRDYLAQLENERRESFVARGKQIQEGRRVEEADHDKAMERLHQDEAYKAADQQDVRTYQRACAERDRSSLAFRGKELQRQRVEMDLQAEKQKEQDHENFETDTLARRDVEEYLKECRRRRRMSLASRAKETRRHAAWKRQQEEKERQERRRLVHGRLMDQRYVELARQEERAKEALEAIRHANRTSTNPFAGLL